MTSTTLPAPAPGAPVTPPAVPSILAAFRAERAAERGAEATVPVAVVPSPSVLTADEPPEPTEPAAPVEPAAEPDARVADSPPAETPPSHRWKDPDTGITLDLRRRDHRKIQRALEHRADILRERDVLAQRLDALGPPPEARREPPQDRLQPDPRDPEPTLDQFAEEPDPYLSHSRALARWDARQEFRLQQATHTRVERARQAQDAITSAQTTYDADLPTVKARYADFDEAHTEVLETLGRLPLAARGPIVHRLLTSPLRHDLTHYLGTHPDDLAAVVSARTLYEQGLTLGAIETQVRALVNQRTAPVRPSPPPPAAPIAPVGSQGHPAVMPDAKTMNLQQFRVIKPKLGMTA